MIKAEYINLKDSTFVPLREGIDVEFLNKYEINKLGLIRNYKSKQIKTPTTKGYPFVTLYSNKKQCMRYVHILVAKTFLVGEIDKNCVDHIDRNKNNCTVYNLRFVNNVENNFNRNRSVNKNLYYEAYDINNNLISSNLLSYYSRNEQLKISKAIREHKLYLGHYWKRINKEVRDLLNKLNVKEKDLSFIPWQRDSNILVSELGIIKNLKTNMMTLGTLSDKNYRYIGSSYSKHTFVHRIVYEVFSNYLLSSDEIIDHIDTNPQNNNFKNLRLSTSKENSNNKLSKLKHCKPIILYDLEMNIIKEWDSAKQIFAYYNIKHSHCLSDCCKGKMHTYKGYIWKYK